MDNPPGVMVSSTFYDLHQIRKDLQGFIEKDLGYRSLLSEFPSFPVDPDADTIENCRQRVEKSADILILIIGGRYGYVDSQSAKSITNLEYLTARYKGIPTYAFVDKRVLPLLPVWKENPDADFSKVVDDVRVFDFIDQVRSVDRVWMHEFEHAQDIIETLRMQFAYLVRDGLEWRLKLKGRESDVLETLHGKGLRIAVEKPKAWEYLLFGQVLTDEIEARRGIRKEYELGIAIGAGDDVPLAVAPSWGNARIEEVLRLSGGLTKLVNEALLTVLGPSGEPGDVEGLVFVARKVGEAYEEAIKWAQRIRRANFDECWRPVAVELAEFTRDIIEKIGAFGPDFLQQIEDSLQKGTPESPITITIKIEISNTDRFHEAIARAKRDCF